MLNLRMISVSKPFSWSEDMVTQLCFMWANDYNTKEIAERLGTTKNAVIGKANRMGLPHRGLQPEKIAKPVAKPKPKPIQPPPIYAGQRRVPMIDLKSRECVCPVDLTASKEHKKELFCGRPAVIGRPYCEECSAKVRRKDRRGKISDDVLYS